MKEESSVSRRRFLAGSAASAAGLLAFGIAGCAPSSDKHDSEASAAKAEDVPTSEPDWDETYDVIVVGSGLAGMATAVTVATEGNDNSCLLLEKGSSPSGNGNSPFSAGMVWATKDYEGCLKYMKALRGENTTVSDAICETYVEGMVEHVDWLRGLGAGADMIVSWEDDNFAYDAEYSEFDTEHASGGIKFDNREAPDGFNHVALFMSSKVDEYSDSIVRKTDSPAKKLVQDPESGAILGVVYESGGKTVYAKANLGVVMCCGGFENNPEMIANYFKAYGCYAAAGKSNTGDGIVMCSEVGAKMWHMANIAGFWPHIISLDETKITSNFEHLWPWAGILVGTNGRRFMTEFGGSLYGNLTDKPEDAPYAQGMRHGDFQYGGQWMHMEIPSISWAVFDKNGFEEALTGGIAPFPSDDLVADGFALTANTIEDLAMQMEVRPEELRHTVDTWNSMVQNGDDVAFHRDPSTMRAVIEPPFYATKNVPWLLNTDGGPQRDEHARVLNYDLEPIPNLYSSGEFGSIWSDMYNGGGNLSEGMIFGRIAARELVGKA